MMKLRDRIRGVIGFPATPFKQDLSLDLDALERNVAEMVRYPFCAIMAPGGIAEVFSLNVEEAVEVLRKTVEVTNDVTGGKMAVFGSACFNTPMAVEMARGMEKAGADALLVLPPYYANAPEDGLLRYYQTIGEACSLPLTIYSRGWAVFTPDQVARLADQVPSLELWKDGQCDARNLQRIMAKLGDRLAWLGGAGDDCAAAYAAVGVQAFNSSISTIAPKLSFAVGDAAVRQDFDRLNELLRKYVHPLFAIRARKRGYEVTVMKKAMEILGKPAGPVRPPLPELRSEDVDDIRRVLETWREFLE